MATYILSLGGFNPVDGFMENPWLLVGVPHTDIMELVEVAEHYITSGQAAGGHIVSNTTGEVLVKWVGGNMVVVG